MRLGPLLAALLALAGPALAHWEYTRWGMTPEQVVQASRGAVRLIPPAERPRLPDADLLVAAEGSFAEGPLRLSVRFGFDAREGLALVVYGVAEPGQNAALRAWLIRRHGEPQRRGGLPAIGMESLAWDGEDEIELTITQGERAFVLHEPKATR